MMTDENVHELVDIYVRQFGSSEEDAVATIEEWRPIFLRRGMNFATVKEAMLRVLEEGPPMRKDTRLSAIIKASGTPTRIMREIPYCAKCNGTGQFTVPHEKDWTLSRFWRGEHTMLVRCLCDNGNKFGPCTTLDFYETRFPNWQEEYPLRMYERKMLMLQSRLDALDGDDPFNDFERATRALLLVKSDYDKLVSPDKFISKTATPTTKTGAENASSNKEEEVIHEGTSLGQNGHNASGGGTGSEPLSDRGLFELSSCDVRQTD